MKKLPLLLLISCFVFTGCGSAANDAVPHISSGNYTYMMLQNSDGIDSVLCRFDIDTGIVTTVCPDPLCRHHSGDCIFSNVSRYYVLNNKIIMPNYSVLNRSNYDTQVPGMEVLAYDIASGSYDIWYKYDKKYAEMTTNDSIIDDYYYCAYIGAVDNDDGTKTYDKNIIYRINMGNGKYEVLDSLEYVPSGIYGNRYYYGGSQGNMILFSTDLSGKDRNKINIGCLISEAFYDHIDDGLIVGVGSGANDSCVFQIDAGTGNFTKTDAGKSIYDLCIGNEYIYFLCYDDNPEYIGHDAKQGRDIYNTTGGKIYRVKIGSSDVELYMNMGSKFSFYHSMKIVDNRIILDYGAFAEDSYWHTNTWNEMAGGKIVVNTIDGEYNVYERTWNLPTAVIAE